MQTLHCSLASFLRIQNMDLMVPPGLKVAEGLIVSSSEPRLLGWCAESSDGLSSVLPPASFHGTLEQVLSPTIAVWSHLEPLQIGVLLFLCRDRISCSLIQLSVTLKFQAGAIV